MTLHVAILIAVLGGSIVCYVAVFSVLARILRRTGRPVARSLVRNLRWPGALIVPLSALEIAAAAVPLAQATRSKLLHGLGIALVVAIAFLILRLTYVFEDAVLARYSMDAADNLKARQIHTQIQILRRITVVVVAVVALSIILLSFPAVQVAGASLLASAGLFGLVAGAAARPTATNVVAGLQIAFSQPIRVDDVVVVDGHWGRVEEIALTYVVVRVWDLRRLIVPVSYFIDQPFENWTRSTSDILGWIFLEVDYRAPVGVIREKLHEILASSPYWDQKVWSLQVTNTGSSTMQLRALMSAHDSAQSWSLQCEVREQLIAFLQEHYPGSLPRIRTEPSPLDPGGDGLASGLPLGAPHQTP